MSRLYGYCRALARLWAENLHNVSEARRNLELARKYARRLDDPKLVSLVDNDLQAVTYRESRPDDPRTRSPNQVKPIQEDFHRHR